jgi:hypothetical protein
MVEGDEQALHHHGMDDAAKWRLVSLPNQPYNRSLLHAVYVHTSIGRRVPFLLAGYAARSTYITATALKPLSSALTTFYHSSSSVHSTSYRQHVHSACASHLPIAPARASSSCESCPRLPIWTESPQKPILASPADESVQSKKSRINRNPVVVQHVRQLVSSMPSQEQAARTLTETRDFLKSTRIYGVSSRRTRC